jgi:hypothetical protein
MPYLLKRHTLHTIHERAPNTSNGLGIIPLLDCPRLDKQCEKGILPIPQHDPKLVPHAPPDEHASRERLLDRGLVTLDGVHELIRFDLPAVLRGRFDRLNFVRLRIDALAQLVHAVVRKAVVAHEKVARGNVEVALGLLGSISTLKILQSVSEREERTFKASRFSPRATLDRPSIASASRPRYPATFWIPELTPLASSSPTLPHGSLWLSSASAFMVMVTRASSPAAASRRFSIRSAVEHNRVHCSINNPIFWRVDASFTSRSEGIDMS